MKHNLLKSVILSVILFMGVSNAWALDIYLDFSSVNWPESGAVIKLYPGTGSDVVGTNLGTVKVYKFTVPEATGIMWFKRINPNNSNETWNEASITYDPNHNNVYKLTGWTSVENADYNISTVNYANYIYFDNSITNWTSTNKYFGIGHDKPSIYSIAYDMYEIENTQLFYTHNIGNTWTDATYYSFFADDNAWSGNGWGITYISTRAKAYTAPFTSHQPLNSGKYYLCTPTSKENSQPFNISEYSSYTDLNHTQTIKAQVKYGETNPAYKQVISPATITATTHYFGSDYTQVDQTGSLTINRGETNPANLTQTVTAAYTSTVTLSYTNLHDAYEFIDWWDDTNKKTISTSSSCTYVATKATTVYARFKAKGNYTRTVYLDARNWNADNPRYAVYAYYGAKSGQFEWIDMTAACGTNWYYTCEVPAKYSHVIFCRMNPANNNNTFNDDDIRWGQTNDLLVLLDLDKNNCFTPSGDPTEQGGKTYNGNWSTPPTFNVTLEASNYGSFQVTCNGETKTEGTISNVLIGTQLTITNIQPNAGYDQTMVYKSGDGNYTEFGPEKTLTVTANTIISEDFRTTEEHDIYLKIPNLPFKYWCNNNENAHPRILFMNATNSQDAYDEQKSREFELISTNTSYRIYKITAPEGYHSFFIYSSHEFTASKSFDHKIIPADPTKNCYELTNEEVTVIDNIPSTNGQWVSAKVTLDPCNIGTYGIIYNEVEYLNYTTTSREIEMPYGSSIQIIDATPTSDHYEKNPRYETSVVKYTTDNIINSASEIIKQNGIIETIKVYGDNLKFAPNLVTKNTHRVFLHIPTGLKQTWGNVDNENYFNTIYLMDYLSGWMIALPTNPKPDFAYGRLEKMSAFETFAADEDEYYYIDIPEGYHTFVFERKHKENLKQWGQPEIKSIILHYGIPTDENNNCFTIIDEKGDEGRQKGTWGPLPTCTLELGYTDIGSFGVRYKGETFYENNAKNQVDGKRQSTYLPIPYGAEVEIVDVEPGNEAFTKSILYVENSEVKNRYDFTEQSSQTLTITKDARLDDFFGTKQDYTIYIGIPKNQDGFKDWDLACTDPKHTNGDEMYIWCHWFYDGYGYEYGSDELVKRTGSIENDEFIFHRFTLPKGIYRLQFQCKENKDKDNHGSAHAVSIVEFNPPLTTANCYILNGGKSGTDYVGYWTTLPSVGDYRLLYAEKELIKDDWETVFRTVYSHPSDIIKKRTDLNGGSSEDIVSLHINTQRGDDIIPMVILQQYEEVSTDRYKWIDIEAHTVLPLKAAGEMAMLPGRKKTYGEFPFYSDGIDAIKNDDTDQGSGVWNFYVEQNVDNKNMVTTLHLNKVERYEGTYYIRTSNATGGWANYTDPDNYMTNSSYSKQYRGFSHYFCKWVNLKIHPKDVSFIVANDHASALTDPSVLFEDQYVTNESLTENANIRWSWNIVDNKVSRAYIRGTWNTNEPPARLDNLVAKYSPNINSKDTVHLDDTGDWIYSKDINNVPVNSKLVSLTAKYPTSGQTQTFAENMTMLTGNNSNDNKYVVRILYDFKIDKTLVALVPNDKQADIGIDVLIQRIDQNEATQVQANAAVSNNDGATVYAMMTFNKNTLINGDLSDQRRFTYWISFPFDVNIDDVFGFSEYGKQWRIREYDGAARAQNGYDGTQTYWKYIDINTTKVLEANKGYILVLNAKLRDPNHSAYTNRDQLSLYFPSANLINNLDTACIETSVVVPQNEGQAPSKDWNWNMIGVPSYANKDRTISQDHLYYFFEYDYDTDSYEVCWAGKEQRFKSMFAYMVQFAGTIDWTNFKVNSGQFPEQLAAKKDASAEINHVMRLELLRNNQREDKTYIQLTENENATEQFDMNFDLTKMANAKANLYSLIGNHQLAANVLPLQTTIVPLGVIIKTAGEYTFSMPDGTDGITAELIDYQTNTRTNLALDNYTVTLPAGTNNTRFAISLQPDKTITGLEDSHLSTDGSQVRKFIIDGQLYMQKDGELYNAQGKLVH